ncbi:DUF3613 domain-containing protein, partial [Bordetella bronchiseptica]
IAQEQHHQQHAGQHRAGEQVADGHRRAGPGLPLQGPVASAAWQRYLESFSQPIPQWFGERIEDNVGGSGGGGG